MCAVVRRGFGSPRTVVEPTCGVGGLLVAAHREFGVGTRLWGIEIDGAYVERARAALRETGSTDHRIVHEDFFAFDWSTVLAEAPTPLVVVGNPPWVTNAELGSLQGRNLPPKTNARGLRGIDALTGRSNFDISEWMCIRLIEALAGRDAGFAVLVKVAVARKVLQYAWSRGLSLREPSLRRIDARVHFGAAVDACLFSGWTDAVGEPRCAVHPTLEERSRSGVIGFEDGELVADLQARRSTVHLTAAKGEGPPWRSGIKHDCARVLELRERDGHRINGLGERVDVEESVLFPLLKSSDVAAGRMDAGRWLVVTQRALGDETERLAEVAPKAWAYLQAHAERLDGRKSSIYRGRPRFCMFGVGAYAFSPWKVVISGLYKGLEFRCVGPHACGRPVVFDDTVYVLACEDEAQARALERALRSEQARRFFEGLVFWDAKRPITAGVLRRLDPTRLTDPG